MTGWRPTGALVRLVLLAFVPMIGGLLAGRPDVVVLATPFVIGGVMAALRRQPAPPEVAVHPPPGHLVEKTSVSLEIAIANGGGQQYDAAVLRYTPGASIGVRRADTVVAVVVAAGTTARPPVPIQLMRWGRPAAGTVALTAYAGDFLLQSTTVVSRPVDLTVVPAVRVFHADDAMPNAAGLVGVHRSRRPGDGGELAGVRAYGPGDRLRRIDWRTSLRTGDLHVAQTLSDRDAELVILLDLLHEAGGAGSTSGPGGTRGAAGTTTVVDTTVHAASDIAAHYLDAGDRVSLQEFGASSRRLRAAAGRRHRLLLLEWLLAVRPATSSFDVESLIRSWPPVPRASLVVVLTPLLDERSAAVAALLARGGRTVVAVDTLPPGVTSDRPGRWADVAFRLGMLERADGIARLLEHGVPTVQWAGAGSLDQVLREMSRRSTGPRQGSTV